MADPLQNLFDDDNQEALVLEDKETTAQVKASQHHELPAGGNDLGRQNTGNDHQPDDQEQYLSDDQEEHEASNQTSPKRSPLPRLKMPRALRNNRFFSASKDMSSKSPTRFSPTKQAQDADERDTNQTNDEADHERDDKSDASASPSRRRSVRRRSTNDSAAAPAQPGFLSFNPSDYIVTPSSFSSIFASRSWKALRGAAWMKTMEEEAACGLFVEDKKARIHQVHPNTLLRMEERLHREQKSLDPLVHPPPHRREKSLELNSKPTTASHCPRTTVPNALNAVATSRKVAHLEILIDQVVFDDHADFTLGDRLFGQLRAAFASYCKLLVQQKWSLPLKNLQLIVLEGAGRVSSLAALANRNKTLSQACEKGLQEAVEALNALESLQTSEKQLVGKWTQLEAVQTREGDPSCPCALDRLRRANAIDLEPIRLFLELVKAASSDNVQLCPDSLRTMASIQKQFDLLQANGQFLSFVFKLRATTSSTASPLQSFGGGSRNNNKSTGRTLVGHFNSKFHVALLVNDKFVVRTQERTWASEETLASSRLASSKQSRRVDFHESFDVSVASFPQKVAVQVIQHGSFGRDLVLSSEVSIPMVIPGANKQSQSTTDRAITLTPTDEWYQFSNTRPIALEQWHGSFRNSAAFVGTQRFACGRVRVRLQWVSPNGVTAHECHQVVLPKQPLGGHRHQFYDQLVGHRVRRKRSEEDLTLFSYEQDFLAIVDKGAATMRAIDPNDPTNRSLLRLQRHVQHKSSQLQQREVFRTSSLQPVAGVAGPMAGRGGAPVHLLLSKRNQLLKKRDEAMVNTFGTNRGRSALATNPFGIKYDQSILFQAPVPLDEKAIALNEQYFSFFRHEVDAFHRQLRQQAVDECNVESLEYLKQQRLLKLSDFVYRLQQNQLVIGQKAKGGVARKQKLTLDAIVQEKALPLFPLEQLEFDGFTRLLTRRRRLRPMIKKRQLPTTMAEWPTTCDLFIQIQRGINVPVREDTGNGGGRAGDHPRAQRKTRRQQQERGRAEEEEEEEEGEDPDDDALDEEEDSGKATGPRRNTANHAAQLFVEVSFQGKRRRTTCYSTGHPHHASTSSSTAAHSPVWMETLVIPFHPPTDDWSPEALKRVNDVIRIDLFDQLRANTNGWWDTSDNATDGAGEVEPNEEVRFLGGLEVPFTVLHFNKGQIEATLRWDVAPVLMGYRTNQSKTIKSLARRPGGAASPRSPRSDGGGDDDDDHQVDALVPLEKDPDGVMKSSQHATYVSVMMTLDPLLPVPGEDQEDVPELVNTMESKALVVYARDWIRSTNRTNRHCAIERKMQLFVHTLGTNTRVLVTRFLHPQTPPVEVQASVWSLVNFVRLIPFLNDWHLFDQQDQQDVWSTSQEFLELNAGDYEEHAVLLCNFFLWFDRNTASFRNFLVRGRAVPEGETVYVLRQDLDDVANTSVLWDASKGIGYSVLDEKCPVVDVYFVCSPENLYANVQKTKRFGELCWSIEGNTKAWKPLFQGKKHTRENLGVAGTIQTSELVYKATSVEFVELVERELKEILKLEIRKWRSDRFTTTFNVEVGLKLRNELAILDRQQREGSANHQGDRKRSTLVQDSPTLRIQDAFGLPMNRTFTDVEQIVRMVKDTKIHLNDRANVEFGLAVLVSGYPNNVLSVWVYFVSLLRRE